MYSLDWTAVSAIAAGAQVFITIVLAVFAYRAFETSQATYRLELSPVVYLDAYVLADPTRHTVSVASSGSPRVQHAVVLNLAPIKGSTREAEILHKFGQFDESHSWDSIESYDCTIKNMGRGPALNVGLKFRVEANDPSRPELGTEAWDIEVPTGAGDDTDVPISLGPGEQISISFVNATPWELKIVPTRVVVTDVASESRRQIPLYFGPKTLRSNILSPAK
jgi:hypothetical protein